MKRIYSKILQGLVIPCMALSISQTTHAQSFTEGFENIANMTDWFVANNSDSPSPTFGWGAGNPATFPAQAGAGYLSCNYQTTTAVSGATISNWLFTPSRVFNNGDVITFYTRKVSANYPDRLQVRLSTNGPIANVGNTSTSVGDFTTLLLDINPTLVAGGYPSTWTQYTITISGLAAPTSGRIAFRYFVTNAGSSAPNSDYIGIDSYTYTSTLPAPSNDNCLGATTLTHAATCTPTPGTILGATASGGIACGDGTPNDDVWYQFVATSANAKIIVDGSTNFDAVFEVSSGSCGALTTIACVDNTIDDGIETVQLSGLTVGQTYFIRVYDWYNTWPISLTFNICVQQVPPCTLTQPVGSITETEICGGTNNNACATPQSISCGTTVWGTTWSSVSTRDIDWYSFTVTTPTSVTLAVQSELPVNAIFMNIADCANPVQLAAGSMDCTNGTVTYNFTTAGTYAIVIVPQTFSANACGTSNDYIATLTMAATAPVLTAGGPITFCPGGSVSLSTTATGTFAWYNGTTLIPTATTNTYVATANGNYTVVVTNSNGCPTTSNAISVTVNALDNATFSYGASSYCVNGTNPTPTAATAGTYSSTAGLNFVSASTGQINLATSTPGTYTVTHTTTGTCPNTSTQIVTVTPLDNANFSYGGTTFCTSSTNPTPTASVTGTFSSSPAGLNFVSTATGEINIAASATGSYTITHTTSGACPNTSSQTITITSTPDATFSYANTAYCVNGTNPSPVFGAGTSAGTFSAGAGLSINATTGVINLAASTPNTYTVTNSIAAVGACPATSETFDVTINTLPTITFAPASVCENTPSVTLSATPVGGTYSGTGITGNTFDPSVGTQTITYAYTDGNNCSATANALITVTPSTDTFSYSASEYCEGSLNQTPTVSGVGTFSSTPAGLSFVSTSTGELDIANSDNGTYTVTFTSTGSCPTVVTQSVTIVQAITGGFAYANSDFCIGATNITPTLNSGATAGTFSATPAGLVFSNANTGEVNLTTSAAGTYTITHTVAASSICPGATATFDITIHALPTATLSGGGEICTGSGDEVDITITLTGSSPWNVVVNNGTFNIPLPSITSSTENTSVGENGAGNYTLISVTDAYCTNVSVSGSASVTVNPLPTITVNDISVCENATVFTLDNATPIGGTYSGTGVTANQFNPAAGTQTITYEYTDANGCSASETGIVTVNELPTVTFPAASVCAGSAPFTPTANPAGGTFSGTGVSANLFNPASGTQTITYSYTDGNNCAGSTTAVITVLARPTATITGGGGTFCQGTSTNVLVTLTGTSPWELVINNGTNNTTIPGITGSTFTIPASESGTYTISTVSDALCSNSGTGSAVVTVNPLPTVIFPNIAVCDDVANVTLSATPIGGNYTGTGVTGNVFNTQSGTQNITYTYTNTNNCSGSATATITVNPSPTVTLSLPQVVCVYAPTLTLSGANPSGGTYFGNGITGNTFNPSAAGLGNQFVNYTYTNSNNCTVTAIGNILVSQCLDIDEASVEYTMSIYPNPATETINFKFSSDAQTTLVRIVSTEGKTVYQNQFQSNQGTLDVNTWARGIYFVHATVDGKVYTSKIVLN